MAPPPNTNSQRMPRLSPTETHAVCNEHGDVRERLTRIEDKLDALRDGVASRLSFLERVVFGACGLILTAVLVAVVALVVR